MTAAVILGNNVDTNFWIKNLQPMLYNEIIILDYDYQSEPKQINGVLYMSANDTKIFIENCNHVKFYKSLYGLPGMSGKMSTLYRKDN